MVIFFIYGKKKKKIWFFYLKFPSLISEFLNFVKIIAKKNKIKPFEEKQVDFKKIFNLSINSLKGERLFSKYIMMICIGKHKYNNKTFFIFNG